MRWAGLKALIAPCVLIGFLVVSYLFVRVMNQANSNLQSLVAGAQVSLFHGDVDSAITSCNRAVEAGPANRQRPVCQGASLP